MRRRDNDFHDLFKKGEVFCSTNYKIRRGPLSRMERPIRDLECHDSFEKDEEAFCPTF